MEKRFGVYPELPDTPHSHHIIQKVQITCGLFTGNYGILIILSHSKNN